GNRHTTPLQNCAGTTKGKVGSDARSACSAYSTQYHTASAQQFRSIKLPRQLANNTAKATAAVIPVVFPACLDISDKLFNRRERDAHHILQGICQRCPIVVIPKFDRLILRHFVLMQARLL